MRCFEKCNPRTSSGSCRTDRDASFVAWCWGAKFTFNDLVGRGHAEMLKIPENNLLGLTVLNCVSNTYSKWRMSRYFSLYVAIKMYLLIVAFLIRGNNNANSSFILTI